MNMDNICYDAFSTFAFWIYFDISSIFLIEQGMVVDVSFARMIRYKKPKSFKMKQVIIFHIWTLDFVRMETKSENLKNVDIIMTEEAKNLRRNIWIYSSSIIIYEYYQKSRFAHSDCTHNFNNFEYWNLISYLNLY